jgi:hypothetical protein
MSDDIKVTVSTVYGDAYQTAIYRDRPVPQFQAVTLNTYHDIIPNTGLDDTQRQNVNYMTIGRGGHYFSDKIKHYKHKKTDANLWEPIPFVIRALDNDLTANERAKYRLRKLIEVDGVIYIAYYGMVLTDDSSDITIIEETISPDGLTTEKPTFSPSDANLYLDPNNKSVTGYPENVIYYTDSGMNISFTPNDIEELKNAGVILNNDEDYCVISEIGIYFAADVAVTNTDTYGGNTIAYLESARAVVALFIGNIYVQPTLSNAGYNIKSSISV